jgi:hypothetical protein
MIHQLIYLACAALVLWAVFKMGQATELLRLRGEMLNEGEPRRVPGSDRDADDSVSLTPDRRASGVRTPSPSSSIFDGEADLTALRLVDPPAESWAGPRLVKP